MKNYIYYAIDIINKILYIVLGLILIICLYSFINLNILSHKYVNFFSYTIFEIGSNSMAPTITTNDLIIVKITKDVDKNDVITYEEGKDLITHRIISKKGKIYTTKGDSNNEEDKAINKSQVIGKVIKILPNYGVWYKVLTTPKIIFLICLTLFSFSLVFSFKEKRILTDKDDFGIYFTGIKLKDDKHDR